MASDSFPADRLRAFAHRVFERLGMPADEAALMADHLVRADLRGASWLGVRKIPQYVGRLGPADRGSGGGAGRHAAPDGAVTVDQMHASPTAPGVERVAVPGERGHALAAARRRNGIPLPAELAARLKKLANELGVPGP